MPPRKSYLLRLPPELLEELKAWAAQDMRSLNAQLEWILREALRARGRAKHADDEPDDRARERRR